MIRYIAAPLLLAVSSPALAHADAATDYETTARRAMEAYDATGMTAAVMVDRKLVYEGALGIADEGTDAPVTQDMRFPIASISKAFTTTALAILVDRGEVEWDKPVRTYIPEFAMYDPWVSEHFTVRDLLTHRSGLPLGAGDLLIWPDGDASPDDIVAALPLLRPTTGFRDGYAYDNLLYVVAGEVVERVSGKSWGDFITDEILRPVGMDQCYAEKSRIPDGTPVVTGHERAPGEESGTPVDPRATFSATWSAAGGIFCPASDMMTWGQFWLDNGKAADGTQVVSEKQARELWTGVTPVGVSGSLRRAGFSHLGMYALGWVVQDFQGRLMVSHSGGYPGVTSNLIILPEENAVIFASSNDYRGTARVFTTQVADDLIGGRDHDFITEAATDFAKSQQEAIAALSGAVEPPADSASPALPLAAYAGTYRDPWYGDVTISVRGDQLYIDMGRSNILDGPLTHFSGNRFAAFWADRSLKADAFVDFTVEGDRATGMTMKAISDITDFSYDFHDLDLKRVD